MEIARRVSEAAAALREQCSQAGRALAADSAILVCFGADLFAEQIEERLVIPYHLVAGLPTGASEPGEFQIGRLGATQVLLLTGGPDLYRNRRLAEACIPIWVAARMGVQRMILIDAALGLDEAQAWGDLLVISDHIDFLPDSPLRGHDHEQLGPAYPDMSSVYHPALRHLARSVASDLGIPIHEGVLACRAGPANETPAELDYLRRIGIDAVANSLVPEAVTARHAGLDVLGISALLDTNPKPHRSPVDIDRMVEAAELSAARLQILVSHLVAASAMGGP